RYEFFSRMAVVPEDYCRANGGSFTGRISLITLLSRFVHLSLLLLFSFFFFFLQQSNCVCSFFQPLPRAAFTLSLTGISSRLRTARALRWQPPCLCTWRSYEATKKANKGHRRRGMRAACLDMLWRM